MTSTPTPATTCVGSRHRVRPPALVASIVVAALSVGTVACTSDDGTTTTPEVTAAEASIAVIEWETDQRDPIVDDQGNVQLPVIYISAAAGQTIDIGVQAAVVEATADLATVRFADDSADSLDQGLAGVPVKDDGVMFVLGQLPEGLAALMLSARRYVSVDEQTTLTFEIVASDDGAKVIDVTEQPDAGG